jgi:hypothetical protein
MERLAKKVGDEPRGFWISTSNVELRDCTLEQLIDNAWVEIAAITAYQDRAQDTKEKIAKLVEQSNSTCIALAPHLTQYRKAA